MPSGNPQWGSFDDSTIASNPQWGSFGDSTIYATFQQQEINRHALERERALAQQERRARAKRLTTIVVVGTATAISGGLLALWGVLVVVC